MNFPTQRLIRWFLKNKRALPWRGSGEAQGIYQVWVSEVMLQQTQVSTVIPYYRRFLERFPTIHDLARASEDEVLKLWEGLGYYNRCRSLHRAAQTVVSRFKGQIPETPEEFKSLAGVGPYIQASVMSIARNRPIPAVDGNVVRVCCRFYGIREDVRKNRVKARIKKELQEIIPPAAPGDFNQALMELGALICTPHNPRCSDCPIQEGCFARQTDQVEQIPHKSPRKRVPKYQVSIAVILKGEKFYIQKRPSTGHLGGMWEFPGGKAKEGETPAQALVRECKEELGTEVNIIEKLTRVHHVYTHFQIDLHVFLCRLSGEDIHPTHHQPFRWITIHQLEEFPLPGANHKFLPALKAFLSTK